MHSIGNDSSTARMFINSITAPINTGLTHMKGSCPVMILHICILSCAVKAALPRY